MSDVILHGVLNMPPELWIDSELDKMQRYWRYMEASRKIEDMQRLIEQQQAEIKKLQDLLVCNDDKLAKEAKECIDELRVAYDKSGLSHFDDAIDIITRLTNKNTD